jgi:hypothetical protein
MKVNRHLESEPPGALDIQIPGGCIACEGVLAVRLTPAGARGYCPRCAWLSRPTVWRQDGAVHVAHSAEGLA